ncbi:hypothetical protein OWM54_09755 [Myxococcus sp. MISCRS1]|uniref:hypothetical protein n=1 Tax=Myxococcus sp. MISCRS1 TaxID=2996786 RepID=UPI002270F078|nr:hypothetical protein [Myxococcus sp. MISCRS1]MCY0997419.1 hypothetical protein [Myxococcus sp. MISCRS1]
MPSRSWYRAVGLIATLGLSACGGDDAPETTYLFGLSYGSDSVWLTPEGGIDYTSPSRFLSADGLRFSVETLKYRLAELRMDLPPEVRCEDYAEVLLPELSCENSVPNTQAPRDIFDFPEDPPGKLHIRGPVEAGTDTPLSIGGKQVFIPRTYYRTIDSRWDPGTPEHPSFLLRAIFTYQERPLVLEVVFQSEEPLRFSHLGVSTGLPEEFADHPAVFGGRLLVDRWLWDVDISSCLSTGDLTLDGDVLRLETGRGACADAATKLRRNIQNSGDLYTGLRIW